MIRILTILLVNFLILNSDLLLMFLFAKTSARFENCSKRNAAAHVHTS